MNQKVSTKYKKLLIIFSFIYLAIYPLLIMIIKDPLPPEVVSGFVLFGMFFTFTVLLIGDNLFRKWLCPNTSMTTLNFVVAIIFFVLSFILSSLTRFKVKLAFLGDNHHKIVYSLMFFWCSYFLMGTYLKTKRLIEKDENLYI